MYCRLALTLVLLLTCLGTIKTSSSVVPVHNPGFRSGYLSIDSKRTTVELLKESQMWADISRANEKYRAGSGMDTLKYRENCKTDTHYKMPNLTPSAYADWILRMQKEEGVSKDGIVSADTKKKHRLHMLQTYTYCINSNEDLPSSSDEDESLHLSPAAVRAALIVAAVIFFVVLGGFYVFIRRLDQHGMDRERERLLFDRVETERVRNAQRAARRMRERAVDVHGVTI